MASNFDTSDFDKSLKELMQSLPKRLEEAVEKACLKVEADAKKECPTDDGTLRASITHEVEIKGDEVNGYIGTNLEYAPYVHQGTGLYASGGKGKQAPWAYKDSEGKWHKTSGQKPNPFLQKAIDKNRTEIIEYLKGVLNK